MWLYCQPEIHANQDRGNRFGGVTKPNSIHSGQDRGIRFWLCYQPEKQHTPTRIGAVVFGCVTNPNSIHFQKIGVVAFGCVTNPTTTHSKRIGAMAFGCVTDPKLYFPKKIGVVAFGCVAHPKTIRSNKDRGNRFWQCHQPENSTLQNNSVMALGCVTNPKTIHSQKKSLWAELPARRQYIAKQVGLSGVGYVTSPAQIPDLNFQLQSPNSSNRPHHQSALGSGSHSTSLHKPESLHSLRAKARYGKTSRA